MLTFEERLDAAMSVLAVESALADMFSRGLISEAVMPPLTKAAIEVERRFRGSPVTYHEIDKVLRGLGLEMNRRNLWTLINALAYGHTDVTPLKNFYKQTFGIDPDDEPSEGPDAELEAA